VLCANPVPRKIVTDQLRSYPAAKAEIPELAHVKHVFVKAATRLNGIVNLSEGGPVRSHFSGKFGLLSSFA
jgi:hypothetical protein